ncbi:MAG: PfkB family carbohydrate kinase [Rhodoglobus sp.]
MTGASILVVGEALVDVFLRADGGVDEAPGGSPANVALALGRLGHNPRLLTRLADDERGHSVRAWLEASAVKVTAVSAPRTATATARLDATGAATYEFDLEWDLAGAEAASAGIVHTGSIAALMEPGATDVARILDEFHESALVTYDPNIRPALLGDASLVREQVEAIVARADLVKASDEDLLWMYPRQVPLDVARSWLASGPAVVVVTVGEGGAIAVSRSGMIVVEAQRVDVVDTVGAGDTFMGALIDGLVREGYRDASARTRLRDIRAEELRSILQFAAFAAAITVSRPGADPPRRDELGFDALSA